MHDRYLGRIERGMDVCDVNGARIGRVAHVYRYDLARIGGADTSQQPCDEIVEVKTGFLGLGKHLYVPLRALQDVTLDHVVLNTTADDAWQSGWDEQPPHLEILR